MAWNSFATPLIGKAVRAASRLAHGGGSAFPGKIVERIDPQFLARTLQQLPLLQHPPSQIQSRRLLPRRSPQLQHHKWQHSLYKLPPARRRNRMSVQHQAPPQPPWP